MMEGRERRGDPRPALSLPAGWLCSWVAVSGAKCSLQGIVVAGLVTFLIVVTNF